MNKYPALAIACSCAMVLTGCSRHDFNVMVPVSKDIVRGKTSASANDSIKTERDVMWSWQRATSVGSLKFVVADEMYSPNVNIKLEAPHGYRLVFRHDVCGDRHVSCADEAPTELQCSVWQKEYPTELSICYDITNGVTTTSERDNLRVETVGRMSVMHGW